MMNVAILPEFFTEEKTIALKAITIRQETN